MIAFSLHLVCRLLLYQPVQLSEVEEVDEFSSGIPIKRSGSGGLIGTLNTWPFGSSIQCQFTVGRCPQTRAGLALGHFQAFQS